MENLQDTLIKFNPIGLEEMDSIQLLDRNETKFLFNAIRLDEILFQAQDFIEFSALIIKGSLASEFRTKQY